MNGTFLRYLRYLMVFISVLVINMGFAADNRPKKPPVRLSGHIPSKAVSQASFVEPLGANESVPITFILPLRNQKALEELIQSQYNPNDANYGKYLSTDEFIKRFAPTQADYDKVIAYAKNSGLKVTGKHPNRTLVNVSGTAKSIQSAFKVNLNVYQQKTNRKFYAPDNDPAVPANIASIITGIVGLDNSAVWHTHNRQVEVNKDTVGANPSAFPSGPNGGFAPNDIKIAYNLTGVPSNGSGQVVGLFELGTYLPSDITTYASYFNLPTPKLTNVNVDGGNTQNNAEVALDIELVLAVAPQSQVYIYIGPNSGSGVLDTYNRIATDNIAKQVSSSWGLGENYSSTQALQAESAIFQQMAAQGQTIYCSAGDSGAYDDYPSTTPVVDDPASQPYMCGVGGTSLTVNANTGAYVSETVWNDGVGDGAGGGGVSTVWPLPSYQSGISTVYSTTNRNVPDISLNSDQYKAYAIYFSGWTLFGGTSCAAPLWAAFTALVNQQRVAAQMSTLGFANPTLYTVAKSQAYATDYHDITTGNNYVYSAGPGYDNATGWGTYNGGNLFASLTNSTPTSISVNLTSPSNGATVSGTISIAATVTSSNPIAHVDFYVDSTLIVSDTASPYTASLNTTTLSNAQHTIKAIAYDNSGNSAQNSVTVTVNNSSALSVNITSPSNGATVSGTISIAATATSSNPIAHVDFYVDSTLIVSDTASPYTASLNTATLSNAQHTIKAIAYDNSGNSAQNSVTVTVNNGNIPSGIYINCGGSAITDPCTGIAWQADQYYTGQTATYSNSSLPSCLGVYTTERYSIGNMTYTIPVSNGKKYVTLKFAELYFKAAGQRSFNVVINGSEVIGNLDIFATAGFGNPIDFTFPVNVTNNVVTITFLPVVQNPKIDAIEINPH